MSPAVSVVIPCYERPAKLHRALASVQAQTLADFEVIVVDDASPTDHRPAVEHFADDRFGYVRHATNRGAAEARSTGAARAAAPIVAFLDSDDEWLPQHLDLTVAALRATPVEAVTTWFEMRYPNGRVSVRKPAQHGSLVRRSVRGVDLAPGSTLVIERAALERTAGWRADIRRCEDYEWFLRFVLTGGEIHVVPRVTVLIDADDDRPLDIRELRHGQTATIDAHRRELEALDPALIRQLRAKFYEEVAWAYWRNGSRLKMAPALVASALLDPAARIPKLAGSASHRLAFRAHRSDLIRR